MKKGQEDVFPTNPDLADILGDTYFDFSFLFVGGDSKFPDFQVPRSPNFKIPRFSGPQPLAPPPAPADKLSDPNLTPLPMHPGIKYIARSPCCDLAVR